MTIKPKDKNFKPETSAFGCLKHLVRLVGNKSLRIPFNYLGADDNAGPNYTGQPVVDSYYQG